MAEQVVTKKPEVEKLIMNGETTVKKEYKKIKKEEQKKEVDKLKAKFDGKYDVIAIDCPWTSKLGEDEEKGARGMAKYPTMQLDKLKKIKLPMKDNCVVWVWFPNYMIKEVIELTDSWQLDRKTILTWDKQWIGTGHYLRNVTEHCILCFKGKPYFNNTKWSTLISERRTGHSVKPEIFFKMVDEVCTGRKLDYFGGKERKNWDVYGDRSKKVKGEEIENKLAKKVKINSKT